jgi:hypothetical protein
MSMVGADDKLDESARKVANREMEKTLAMLATLATLPR